MLYVVALGGSAPSGALLGQQSLPCSFELAPIIRLVLIEPVLKTKGETRSSEALTCLLEPALCSIKQWFPAECPEGCLARLQLMS